MQLNLIHEWLNFETNKKLGTYFTPEENDAALERGQMDEFNALKDQYADDESIQDSLSVFKGTPPYQFTNSTSPAGVVTVPAEYIFLLGIQVNVIDSSGNVRYKGVELMKEDELALKLDSQLRPVTVQSPIARKIGENTIQLYPEVPQAGFIYYLFKPPTPKFVYTQVGRVITYDPVNSIQMLWDDATIMAVMIRALQYLGVSVEDGDLTKFAQAKIQNPN